METTVVKTSSISEMLASLVSDVKTKFGYFTGALSLITSVSLDICDAKSIEETKTKKYLEVLDQSARIASKLIQANLARVSALERIIESLKNVDLDSVISAENGLSKKFQDEFEQNINRVADIKNNRYYLYYRRTLWERQNPGIPFTRSDLGGSNDCDENTVALLSSKIKLICPLTKAPLKEPVVSVSCLHFFSKEAILEHIRLSERKTSVGKVRCPVAGCNSFVSVNLLIESSYLERKVCVTEQENTPGSLLAGRDYSFFDRG